MSSSRSDDIAKKNVISTLKIKERKELSVPLCGNFCLKNIVILYLCLILVIKVVNGYGSNPVQTRTFRPGSGTHFGPKGVGHECLGPDPMN